MVVPPGGCIYGEGVLLAATEMAAPGWVDHLLAQWRTVVVGTVDGLAALAPKPGVDPAEALVRSPMLPDTTAVYRWLPVFRGSMRLMLLVQSFSTAEGDDHLDLEMRLLFRKRLMQPAPCKGLAEAPAGDASEGQREAKKDALFGALWDYMGDHTPCPRAKSPRDRDNEEEWLETLDSIRVAFEVG